MSDRPAPIVIGTSARIRVHRGPRVDGRWYWRADKAVGKGKREHLWSGWGTPEEAEAEVLAVLGGGRRDVGDTSGTVRELMETWSAAIDERPDLAERTRANYEDIANRITLTIGPVLLERLDRRVLERYRDQRLREGASSTVALDLRTLRQAWEWGREVGIAPERDLPRVRVRKRKGEGRPKYTPTTDEVLRVLDELLPGDAGVALCRPLWYSRAAWLLLATGCRIGEIADLRRRDVDLDTGTLHVVGKTGPRDVPLSSDACGEIGTWDLPEHPEGRVWGRARTTVLTDLGRAIHAACDRAEVPHWTPQALRRHAVDALYQRGIDPTVAAAILGHSPAVALAYYRQAATGDLREAVERLKLGALPKDNVRRLRGAKEE